MNKKIKVVDKKKWVIKMFVSLGIWTLGMIILSVNFVPNHQDMAVPVALALMAMLIGYWIYSYITTNKYIEADEFLDFINDKSSRIYFENKLKKVGFSPNEIQNLLKDRFSDELEDESLEEDQIEIQNESNEELIKNLKELKELFDINAITKEEFEEKKKELLK